MRVLEERDRTASRHGQFHAVDDEVAHAPDEPLTDVLSPIGHRDHLGAKEHIVTVEVQHIVGARRAAVRRVRAVDDDLGVLAEAFDDDGVPVAVVDVDGVDACDAWATSAVKFVLENAPVYQLTTRNNNRSLTV